MKKFIILMIMIAAITGLFANTKAFVQQNHYRWRNDNGDEANATWMADEDVYINIATAVTIRLRFDIRHTIAADNDPATATLSNTNLQYSLDDNTWVDVTIDGSVNHFVLALSDNFADGDVAPSDFLTNGVETTTQSSGVMYETTSSFGGTIDITTGYEYEWCIQPTGNVTSAIYYFRVWSTVTGGDQNLFSSAQSAVLVYGPMPTLNPPQNLSVTDVGYATWNAPVAGTLTPTGYNVSLDGGFVSFTTDLFYDLDDGSLVDAQSYLVEVTAVYDYPIPGESALVSDTFVYDAPPILPTGLSVDVSAYATWSAPVSDTPDGYNVYLDDDFVSFTTNLYYDLDSGLNDGQLYKAEVTAIYGVEESVSVGDIFTYGTPPTACYTLISVTDGGNPGGLNTDGDTSASSWTEIVSSSQDVNIWSDVVALPADFDFLFFGQSVSEFKVSQNGLLTFDIYEADPPPSANTTLPGVTVPDLTIAAFWDEEVTPTGSSDIICMKEFGTAPNRQIWIKYHHSTYSAYAWCYFGLCLEETTNKIYLIDYKYRSGSGSSTIGLQYDSSTAVEHAASPNYSFISGASVNTDNDYFEFTPSILCVPEIPQNIIISLDVSGIVTIGWDEVTGATGYKIYSCDEPYGTFIEIPDEDGDFSGTSWTSFASMGAKKFFKVTAINE